MSAPLPCEYVPGIPSRKSSAPSPVEYVLVEGLKRIKGEISPEALLKALETVDTDLGGFKVRFSPNNRIGSSYIDVTLLRGDGQLSN